jgi:hypothetical protein
MCLHEFHFRATYPSDYPKKDIENLAFKIAREVVLLIAQTFL